MIPGVRVRRHLLAQAQARAAEYDRLLQSAAYNNDGLIASYRNLGFLRDERFLSAYRRGADSGHKITGGKDIHIEWRAHVACWAAERGLYLPGAFVECGVNTGILSLAVCEYVDFNASGKDFYLFDTFNGIPESQMFEDEKVDRMQENTIMYEDCFECAQQNFTPFPRAKLV